MFRSELDSYLYAQRFYFLAEQCLNIIQKSLTDVLKEFDVSYSQHLILLVLRYAELSGRQVMSTDIAYLLGREKHTITTVVDKLAERQLVTREQSRSDRRVHYLRLTEKGGTLAAAIHQRTIPEISLVPQHAREEFAHMCDFLRSVRSRLADATGQPAAAYDRAYQTLVLDGQNAFARRDQDLIHGLPE